MLQRDFAVPNSLRRRLRHPDLLLERDVFFVAARFQGKTVVQIARLFGVSRQFVYFRSQRFPAPAAEYVRKLVAKHADPETDICVLPPEAVARALELARKHRADV